MSETVPQTSDSPPRVFISYSHDSDTHQERVRALAERLRGDGIDVQLDRWLPPAGPDVGWARWMETEIRQADFVLVVCTATYHERFYDPEPSGAGWEGAVLTQELYEDGQRNARFLPLLFADGQKDHIPMMLRRGSWFEVATDDGYDKLYRQLTGQPEFEKPPLGQRKSFEPRPDADLYADLPPPEPTFASDHHRQISIQLDEAWDRHATRTAAGEDTTEVMDEILDLKRKLRSGPDLKAGDILGGRFKLLDPLGSGGFGTVWRAYDKKHKELVAVKVLHGQHVQDESRRKRFFRGSSRMARLDHAGIVRVIDEEAEDGGFYYFAMEYAAGGDLHRAVLDGKLSRDEAVDKVLTVGDALDHAHKQGCIHRDVKPANILLTADGCAKLSDFDLVRARDTTGGTRTDAALGSFLYSAPESLADAKRAGVAADVYSLGVTLAFALYGKDLPLDLLRRSDDFIQALPAPPAVRRALLQATAWERDSRWTSVAAFVAAVREGFEAGDEAQPAQGDPAATAQAPRHRAGASQGSDLVTWVERSLPELPPGDRAAALLDRAGAVDPGTLDPGVAADLRTLGILAWALDYYPNQGTKAQREAAHRLRDELFAPLRTARTPPDLRELPWREIPEGRFAMGSPQGEGDSDEHPAHEVTLSSFRLGTVPVTNRTFRLLAPDHAGQTAHPVVQVDWYTAYTFAAWLGGRLPTEAEWEYACRAGTTTRYWSGYSEQDLDRAAWYSGNARRRLHRVGDKDPNPWGLHDVHGLVWEWVADWYGPYKAADQTNPWGPAGGDGRVLRGGSFDYGMRDARAAHRVWDAPGNRYPSLGFRVLLPTLPTHIDTADTTAVFGSLRGRRR